MVNLAIEEMISIVMTRMDSTALIEIHFQKSSEMINFRRTVQRGVIVILQIWMLTFPGSRGSAIDIGEAHCQCNGEFGPTYNGQV